MAKPEIGLSMLYCLNEPFSSLLKHLDEINVKHVELPDEGLYTLNKRRVRRLKEAAETNNFDYVVHAPWAGINIAASNPVLRRTILKRLEKSIVYAGQLGCRLWLFHPGSKTALSHIYPGKDWQQNLDSVRVLLKVARREGVEVAVENVPEPFPFLMKSVADFRRFYDELNDIGIVLDLAHASLNNQIRDFMKHFSEKIVHIHASDNDGVNDLHLGIGYGSIDWQSVAKTVKDAGYSNLIVLESTDHVEESLQTLRRLFL
jgi:L-ribulose-5-phosphate 3-epimerase